MWMEMRSRVTRQTLLEIARVFLRLGIVSFGGPAAHIALMEDEVVNKRKWVSAVLLIRFKIIATWLILAGGAAGYVLYIFKIPLA